jgi:hypothetical protein
MRTPAESIAPSCATAPADPFDPLIVCLDCPRPCHVTGRPGGEQWRQCADVLYAGRPRPCPDTAPLALRALERYPGCLLVVVRRAGGTQVTHARRGSRRAGPSVETRGLAGRDLASLLRAWYADLLPKRPAAPRAQALSPDPPGPDHSDGLRAAAHQER